MAKKKEYDHDRAIEAMCDYKRGLRNFKTGTAELVEATGLSPEIAGVFLKAMKRDNVRDIRGYTREPERLIRAREEAAKRKRDQ